MHRTNIDDGGATNIPPIDDLNLDDDIQYKGFDVGAVILCGLFAFGSAYLWNTSNKIDANLNLIKNTPNFDPNNINTQIGKVVLVTGKVNASNAAEHKFESKPIMVAASRAITSIQGLNKNGQLTTLAKTYHSFCAKNIFIEYESNKEHRLLIDEDVSARKLPIQVFEDITSTIEKEKQVNEDIDDLGTFEEVDGVLFNCMSKLPLQREYDGSAKYTLFNDTISYALPIHTTITCIGRLQNHVNVNDRWSRRDNNGNLLRLSLVDNELVEFGDTEAILKDLQKKRNQYVIFSALLGIGALSSITYAYA